MDRHRLELALDQAKARVVQGQLALLQQRLHVRDLERAGLETAMARELLWRYEQSQAMNLFERDSLRRQLAVTPAAQEAASSAWHEAALEAAGVPERKAA